MIIRTTYGILDHIFEQHPQCSPGNEMAFPQKSLWDKTELTAVVTFKFPITFSEIQITGMYFIWERSQIYLYTTVNCMYIIYIKEIYLTWLALSLHLQRSIALKSPVSRADPGFGVRGDANGLEKLLKKVLLLEYVYLKYDIFQMRFLIQYSVLMQDCNKKSYLEKI